MECLITLLGPINAGLIYFHRKVHRNSTCEEVVLKFMRCVYSVFVCSVMFVCINQSSQTTNIWSCPAISIIPRPRDWSSCVSTNRSGPLSSNPFQCSR